MSTCLVQQLFRQKIGALLDPLMIDEILFPLLLSKKDLPRELLLDIKMTQSCNDEGRSAITHTPRSGTINRSISPFTNTGGRYRGALDGKNSSKVRRLCSLRASWGSIDILNELRNLKYPFIGGEDRGNYFLHFLRLEENVKRRTSGTRIQRQNLRRANELSRHNTLEFVNDYLELVATSRRVRSDPCLVWDSRNRTIRY